VEYAPTGTTTWRTACTATAAPYSCSWSSAAAADGTYDLRAVATDLGTNATASALRTGVRVDNVGPSATVTSAAGLVRATVSLGATAADPAGVASVTFQSSTGGGWTDLCTTSTAPYTCAWNTAAAPDGYYTIRLRSVDGLGHTAYSAAAGPWQVDNTRPAPADVQAVNGAGTAGRIDAGDRLTFTWSEPIKPSTLAAGFTGASLPVIVQVTDGGATDTLQLLDSTGTTALKVAASAADVALGADFVSATASWNATLAQSGTAVTLTIGSLRGGTIRTAGAGTITWRASTAATDLAGNAVTGLLVSEQGNADVDF
jgi:hypothetical protein